MVRSRLTEPVQTNITKPMKKDLQKKWRQAGYSSEADYIRDLIRVDLKN